MRSLTAQLDTFIDRHILHIQIDQKCSLINQKIEQNNKEIKIR